MFENESKNQNKVECYQAINRKYILQNISLIDQSLVLEKGRHTWMPKEVRVCAYCDTGEVETETHFLLNCGKYKEVREKCFDKLSNLMPQFSSSVKTDQMQMLLGERQLLINFHKIHFSAAYPLKLHIIYTFI